MNDTYNMFKLALVIACYVVCHFEIIASQRVYMGCFNDDPTRMFPFPNDPKFGNHGLRENDMSLQRCFSYCASNKYVYSGIQSGLHCFCGNDYPITDKFPKRGENECNRQCPGDKSSICGGDNYRQSVYRDCSILTPNFLNCVNITCDNSATRGCTKCTNTYLYKLDSSKQCKDICSWNDRWCWPGRCLAKFTTSCQCMVGFKVVHTATTTQCQLTTKPVLDSCLTKVNGNGSYIYSNNGSPKCSEQSNMYGRFQVDSIEFIHLNAYYHVNIDKNVSQPAFVTEYAFGITDVGVELTKVEVSGSRVGIGNSSVKKDPFSTNPLADFSRKNFRIPMSEQLSNNGEKICWQLKIKGGGYLQSKNIQNSATKTIPYDKTETSRELCYIYDIKPPRHCIETNSCTSDPLRLSSRLTRSKKIEVFFGGWSDPYPEKGSSSLASGIEAFELSVYEMESSSTVLMRDRTVIGKPVIVNSNETSFDLYLPDKNPMVYAILLEVKDIANNVRQARRFVLYDNSSKLRHDNHKPILVTTASNTTGLLWQVNHKQLCFSWKGRFYNDEYTRYNPLLPIKQEAYGAIKGHYEQIYGSLSVNGTTNINGITSFNYSLYRNNVTKLSGIINNISSEFICLNSLKADGDTFIFNLQASDIMNNTINDSAVVYIDRSVPEIQDVGIIDRHQHTQMYVHNSKDLSTMSIQFTAYDIHSGLKEMKWAFGMHENKTILIEEALAVTDLDKVNCSKESNCYCPKIGKCALRTYIADLKKLKTNNGHIGDHNRRYFFTLKVTNKAELIAVDHLDILIDDSPPAVGVVLEGPIGSPDIDYTHSDEVTIHWHDFIDHESGIKLYKVALGRKCYSQIKDFLIEKHDVNIHETNHDSIKIRFQNGEGQYFVSIIAYNNAMTPSIVVCSDGITFDKTVPIIGNVSVKHSNIKETIACESGTPYLITNILYKVKLQGDECMQKCMNSTTDNILTILPEDIRSRANSETVFTFLCTKLDRYNQNTIYTPSDLFEISWNIQEDLSQIGSSYIGFGSDTNQLDNPGVMDYVNSSHLTQYIQHHPGLIGEQNIYIFIKVCNRAGLDTKIWFGPVIADETPPVCPPAVNAFLDNNTYVIINWTRRDLFDTEQIDEIGKIMFRFGTRNTFVTPFLAWNIKAHGGQCGSDYRCIKYPVNELQKYATVPNSLFYAQLHVYNYAGHYCTTESLKIQLPSLIPPRTGIVMDVLPNSNAPYFDTDIIFDTGYCFVLIGFDHHEDVHLQAGLGTSHNLDEVVPFHDITTHEDTLICEHLENADRIDNYFVTIKVSWSGGHTFVSSDGFRVLNKTLIMSSFNVNHGDICDDGVKMDSRYIQMAINTSEHFLRLETLYPGSVYSLYSNFKVQLVNSDLFVKGYQKASGYFILKFVPLKAMNKLYIVLSNDIVNITESLEITVFKCDADETIQSQKTLIPINWSLDSQYLQFVTHYLTAVCKSSHDQCKDSLMFTNSGNTSVHYFHGNFTEGYYKAAVIPCFGQICLSHVFSKEFAIVRNLKIDQNIETTMIPTELCTNTTITARQFVCSNMEVIEYAVAYRWALFSDEQGHNMLSQWKLIRNQPWNETAIRDQFCPELPVYAFTTLYVCIDSFCQSGTYYHTCSVVNTLGDPNTFNKDILYDLNINSQFGNEIQAYKHSENIGEKLLELHGSEMDFAGHDVKIGGYIIGKPDLPITWYLTRDPNTFGEKCAFDPHCLLSKNTIGGFVNFENLKIIENGILYICAKSSTMQTICSDGFVIDENFPTGGQVSVEEVNGFVFEGSTMSIQWTGFEGNKDALQLGYNSDMAGYKYAIGSSPGASDVVGFTTVGLETSVVATDIHMRAGQICFVTIRAYNHRNKTVDVYSDGVIYDNSPPTVGIIQIESRVLYYVTSYEISVQWNEVEDNESGIRKIQIGIGSSNRSADIIPFQEFENYGLINTKNIQDGHRYFAILKATNGAGLSSFTVSRPFVIDTTPPVGGHIMDVVDLNSKVDVDFQKETNFIRASWLGFNDPHSHVIHYKIGLGTSYGKDDVMKLVNVGLQTSKVWALSFSQGVKYYSTVEACNGAGLCSTATSNGILIDNSAPVPGLVVVGEPGKHTHFISDRKTFHASWIGFEDPQSGIDHFDVCLGSSVDTCDIMKSLNVQLASSIIKTKLNMSVGVDYFVSVTACNYVNLCTKRSSPSFKVDNTPPVVIDKPLVFSIHQDNTTSQKIISDPSFFKVFWKFRDSESPIIKTTLTIHSNLDSHMPVNDIFISNEGEFVVQLTEKNILRQGDIYIVRITSCNAASMCTSAASDEFLVDSTPPQMGGFRSPLEYEITNITNKLYLNLSWYGFFDVETEIRAYYISVGYTYSETQIVDGYKIIPATITDFQQAQIVANMSDSIMDYFVLTIWAENNAGIMTSQAKVTTDILPNNYDQSKGNLLIQMHSCANYFCEDDCRCDCTCGVVGRKCLSDNRNTCKNLTSRITPLITVNVSVKINDPELSVIGSSQCLGSYWEYDSNKPVIRFEYSFGIKGEAIGLGVFNSSHENVWYDIGRRTWAFHCLLKTQLIHKTVYVAYVKAWTTLDEYAIFESDPVIVDHTPPAIHKKHFVTDFLLSCNQDVDFITSNDSISACWMGVFSEDESYIKSIMVSLGTSRNVDDIVAMKDVGKTFNITWTNIKFEPGTRYFTTVRAVNSIGLQSEVSSDGFVIDDIPPVSGIVYNTKHHRDVMFQSYDESVQFSWHGFDDEHSFIDSYFVAFDIKRGNTVEQKLSKFFIPIGMSDNVLFNGHIKHNDKITAYIKARDKAGHDSQVVMSQTLQIDATSPISFTCLNFQPFKHEIIKASTDRFETSKTLDGNAHDVFRIRIQIHHPKIDFQSYLKIGDMLMLSPYAMNADGSAITQYVYMLHESGKANASVLIYGTQHNTTVDFAISKCSRIKYNINTTEIISAQQISQDAISVCVQTIDLESGIKQINVGVGSIPNGFEIQSLYPLSSHLHQVITGRFSHGMKLYVKAEAENHAGLKSIFTSRYLVFDQTPPRISHNRTILEYVLTSNEKLVMVKSSWYVIDDESEVMYCEHCIGSSSKSCDIVKMTHTSELTSFKTKSFHAKHGSKVFATFRCINKVQLTGYGHYGPVCVSYLPPDATNSKIQFITDTSTNSLVQINDHSITFHWDAFEDLSELKTYNAQLSNDGVTLLGWIDVKSKNYIRISSVDLENNQNFTVCVKGRNIGGKESKIISNSITVNTKKPVLTGNQVIIEHMHNNDYIVEWSCVFAEVQLVEHYEVSIGSMEGSSDILIPITTTEISRNVYISEDIKELSIVITGFSETGMSETYRHTLNLRK